MILKGLFYNIYCEDLFKFLEAYLTDVDAFWVALAGVYNYQVNHTESSVLC